MARGVAFDAWNESLLTVSHDTACAVGAGQLQHSPASTRLLSAAKHHSSNVNLPAILAVLVRYTQSFVPTTAAMVDVCGCGCQCGRVWKESVCWGPGWRKANSVSSQPDSSLSSIVEV